MVYLVAEVISVLIGAALFYLSDIIFDFTFMGKVMDPFSTAMVNTLLRLFMVILLTPCIDLLQAIVSLLVPEKKDPSSDLLVRLEERFLPHPTLALEQSRLTINDMVLEGRAALRLRAAQALLRGRFRARQTKRG